MMVSVFLEEKVLFYDGTMSPHPSISPSAAPSSSSPHNHIIAISIIIVIGAETDPISEEWEKRMLCAIGTTADPDDPTPGGMACDAVEGVKMRGFTTRSFGDEFGEVTP
jgi:hypothetical protein